MISIRGWKLIVIDKPKGVLSNIIKDKPNLEQRLRSVFGQQFVPINRLDRMTDGWIAYCNSDRLRRKIKNFWDNSVREYLLISNDAVPIGTHRFYCKKQGHKVRYKGKYFEGATLCVSKILYSKKINKLHLVRVRNITGFTHQVRILLRFLHRYIVGDDLYKKYITHEHPLQLSAVKFKMGPFEINNRVYSIHAETRIPRSLQGSIMNDLREKITSERTCSTAFSR